VNLINNVRWEVGLTECIRKVMIMIIMIVIIMIMIMIIPIKIVIMRKAFVELRLLWTMYLFIITITVKSR
jgi:hypothetical protein